MRIINKVKKIKLALQLAREVKELRFLQLQYAMLRNAHPNQIGLVQKKDQQIVLLKQQVDIVDVILEEIERLEK